MTPAAFGIIYNLMVIYGDRLDEVFGALANEKRRSIVKALTSKEMSVLELAALFEISQPAITKHINVLERSGLVIKEKRGRHRFCNVVPDILDEATVWIQRCKSHWEASFDALDSFLSAEKEKEKQHGDIHD